MIQGLEGVMRLLPVTLRAALSGAGPCLADAEELRLRIGREPTVLSGGREHPLPRAGSVSRADIDAVIENAACASLYSVAEQLRRGFITAPGGVRVGVCGAAACSGGIAAVRDVSSLALRVPREVIGAGAELLSGLDLTQSVLIISPPGGGKTTLLRELIRRSSGAGNRVCVADERGEIAGVSSGEPQFDVGARTDVFSFAPKAEAAMLLLRAMNPQIIAFDEITRAEDAAAIEEIANCGVSVYATAHAASPDDLRRRRVYRDVLSLGVFSCAVLVTGTGSRRYEAVAL